MRLTGRKSCSSHSGDSALVTITTLPFSSARAAGRLADACDRACVHLHSTRHAVVSMLAVLTWLQTSL